jgi:hypothetical protein
MVAAVTTLLRHLLPCLIAFAVLPSNADAHVLDEYLQATLVAIEPGGIRLHINLTPGVEIADKVIVLIDRDRNGEISTEEAAAYGETLKRDLAARLDGRESELKLVTSNVPAPAQLRTGMGIIKMEFSLMLSALKPGAHKLAIDNRHLPAMGVYLFNAAKPRSGAVQITSQQRNNNQSMGTIEFSYSSHANSYLAAGLVASLAAFLVAVVAGAWRMRNSTATAT